MSRTRFIADNARGSHGGHNDFRQTFSSVGTAKRHVNKGDKRFGTSAGRILIVELDELEVHGSSTDERWQFHERQMQRHAQLCMELRPGAALAETPDAEPLMFSAADVRHVSLVADRWLRSRGRDYREKERARRDLESLLFELFRDDKLRVDPLGKMFYGPLDGATK